MGQNDIEGLYQNVSKRIAKDNNLKFSQQLHNVKSNEEKVRLVYNIIQQYNMFPAWVKVEKESHASEKYRNMGNEEFKTKNNSQALKLYNRALVNAPLDSPELYLAYSNRSAANFAKKNYTECLKDIHRTLSFKCDDKLREKLEKRKMLCEKELKEKPYVYEIESQCKRQFKLSKSQHETMPAASESLELMYSEEMGRSIIAAQNIFPGEVLALEEPYCCLVLEPFYLEYCYGCLNQCDSMVPCNYCCYAMFCDEECRDKACQLYHRIDCKLMPLLSAMKFTKLELLALRTVIQAKCTHDKCEELSKVIKEAEAEKDPLLKGFSLDATDNKKKLKSQNYCAIHMLESNVEKRDLSDIFQKAVTASVFLHSLLTYTDFFSECGVSEDKDNNRFDNKCVALYGGLLLHHNMTSPSNMHTISTITATSSTGYTESARFGGGAFAFLSLLNHSCAPNVVRFCNGSNIALVALRPIKKGQQLFDNYGYHHATDTLVERQTFLKFQYKFKCQCEACVDDWPLYHHLPSAQISDRRALQILSHNLLTQELFEDLTNGNRNVALQIINQLYPYVTVLENSAPCKELADYQETIKQCWSLFGNVAPLR